MTDEQKRGWYGIGSLVAFALFGAELTRGQVASNPRRFRRNPDGERFVARAVGYRGNVIGEWEAATIAAAQSLADRHVPEKAIEISIRGESTSDGSRWGLGRGRLVAVRESGRWAGM